jgi:hypothetical protein
MTHKDLYNYIRTEIINELSEGSTKTFIASSSSDEENSITTDSSIPSTAKAAAIKALKGSKPGASVVVPTNEMSRIAKKVSVNDLERIKIAKEVYGGSNVEKIIDLVVEAGDEALTQEEIAAKLNISDPRLLNSDINLLVKAGAFKKPENKPVKPTKASPEADLASVGIPKVTDNPEDVDDDELVAVEKDEWETPEKEEEKPEEPKINTKTLDKDAKKVVGSKTNSVKLSNDEQAMYDKFKTSIDKQRKILANDDSSDEQLTIARALLSKYKANKDLAILFKKVGSNLISYIDKGYNEIK